MRVRRGIGAATVAVIVVAILALAVVAYYYEGTSVQPASTTKSSTTGSTTTTTTGTTPTVATVQVIIPAGTGTESGEKSHLTFDPQNITVVIGVNNTVEWVNQDSVTHSVTGLNYSKLSDSNITSGETYTFTFTVPGTYPYKCIYHFWMTGTIKVVEPKA